MLESPFPHSPSSLCRRSETPCRAPFAPPPYLPSFFAYRACTHNSLLFTGNLFRRGAQADSCSSSFNRISPASCPLSFARSRAETIASESQLLLDVLHILQKRMLSPPCSKAPTSLVAARRERRNARASRPCCGRRRSELLGACRSRLAPPARRSEGRRSQMRPGVARG